MQKARRIAAILALVAFPLASPAADPVGGVTCRPLCKCRTRNKFDKLSVHTFGKANARTDRTGNLWDSLSTSAG